MPNYKVEQFKSLTGQEKSFEAQTPTEAKRKAENAIMDLIKLTPQATHDLRMLVRARLEQGNVIEMDDNMEIKMMIDRIALNQISC